MKNTCPTWTLGLLLLTCTAQAAKIYFWTDANGVTHYTDAPPPGQQTKELDLRAAPAIGNAPHEVQVSDFDQLIGADKKKADENKAPEVTQPTIVLLSPEQGSTLRDNTGNLVFQGQISPQAPAQYDVRLVLDGKAAATVHNSLSIRIENLERGAHEAKLELLAKDGTVLATSKPATFYLHRTTVEPTPKPTPRTN